MRRRAAKFFRGHDFVRHGLHDVRTRDEHVRRVFDHKDEIGHRGRVNRATRARPHHQRDLRNDARGENIALKYIGIAAK